MHFAARLALSTFAVSCIGAASVAPLARIGAQTVSGADAGVNALPAGGEVENYLRYLEATGRTPFEPWSLRAFSPEQVANLSRISGPHPWARSLTTESRTPAGLWLLPPEASITYNTAYPFGGNDGPLWTGRGATVSVRAGAGGKWGPLHFAIRPVAFYAQNSGFQLLPTGVANQPFLDPTFPVEIDRPQRFGDRPYARVDPGESFIRLDVRVLSVGVSTAEQWWGPATTFPYVLGNNAAGVPHVFIGTARPQPIGIGALHTRLVYGYESQSAFSPVQGSRAFRDSLQTGTLRFMSGLVVVFQPRGAPHLELGAARYFDNAWQGHLTRGDLASPFEGLLKAGVSARAIPGVPDTKDALRNQLASLFFRWTLPSSGFELYSEYGREDHSADARDLAAEPDHSRTAMVGFRSVVTQSDSTFTAIRAEVMDAGASTLARHRLEGRIYTHYILRQGHTQYGQVLGSDIGVGSMAGATLAVDRYFPSGRSTWFVQRTVQDPRSVTTLGLDGQPKVTAALGYDRLQLSDRVDVGADITAAYESRIAPRTGGFNATLRLAIRPHAFVRRSDSPVSGVGP